MQKIGSLLIIDKLCQNRYWIHSYTHSLCTQLKCMTHYLVRILWLISIERLINQCLTISIYWSYLEIHLQFYGSLRSWKLLASSLMSTKVILILNSKKSTMINWTNFWPTVVKYSLTNLMNNLISGNVTILSFLQRFMNSSGDMNICNSKTRLYSNSKKRQLKGCL